MSKHGIQIITFILAQAFILVSAFSTSAVSAPSVASAEETTAIIAREKPTECATEIATEFSTEIQYETNQSVEVILEERIENEENGLTFIGNFWCTSYCSCPICCGQYAYNRPLDENGNAIVYGASGSQLVPGYSIAVDPRIIPYGTVVTIDGQEYVAADTGISGYHIDFYCASHEEALQRGNFWAEVYVNG